MSAEKPAGTVERIAVVGAGNMGSGIAQKAATEGFEVILLDLDGQAVERGMGRIDAMLQEARERRIFDDARTAAIRGRIRTGTDLALARDAQLVIEAVFEDRAVKQDVFRRLDDACPPETILATNTSSFRVVELARGLSRPERVLGLHFFYHPAKNRLVEVVPHGLPDGGTDPGLRDAAWRFCERLGKTPIASADAPGFVVNRYFVPWLNEAVRLLEEGIADVPTIEAAAQHAFHIGMGPFWLMNVTGVPIALHAATTLGQELGPFYVPSARLAEQVASGKPWLLDGEPDPARYSAVERRLTGAAWLAAGQLVDEGVASLEDTDIGARVGLRWGLGPFELANALGVAEASARVAELGDRWNAETPAVFRAREGRPFRFERVRYEVAGGPDGGVATITFNRPDAMNALNEEVVGQLQEAWDRAEADPAVQAVVLAGAGKAFVAGADIKLFVDCIDAGDLGRIRRFTEAGQALWRRIDESAKPVSVRLDGLSLGGGSELALCADRILATERGSLGFPETGIGIYPGLGGTQRLTRRIGVALARYYVFTGETITAQAAAALGLAQLVDADALHDALAKVPPRYEYPAAEPQHGAGLPEPLAKAAEFFGRWNVDDILNDRAETAGDADKERWVKRVKRKAVPALRLAEKLIDEGRGKPLVDGLALELAHLEEIFRTPEARKGLGAVIGK